MTFSVRAAAIGDLPDMMALAKHAATAAHWSATQYEGLFHNSGRVALVMEEAGLQGFVVARVVDREWEIENIAIAGAARRRGLGTRLLGELLDLARAQNAAALFLEVRESNQAARALYEKWAFVESGRRRGYYKDPPEDAILYRLAFA
ncbi:MAG: ribosomal protein S18-alanine N-acetyltransferase [Terriglobales bacterium]